ncbi:MAG: pilus assembly protein TadG-related protein [Actinomycetota bacterium]
MTIRDRLENEGGAILITAALSLVVLMVFAALTVDLGAAWAERRYDQSAADAAVLAAAVEASTLEAVTIQGLVDEAILFAEKNLKRTITAADWAACVDTEPLSFPVSDPIFVDPITGVGPTPATQCISFGGLGSSGTFEEIRVKLPDQVIQTSFARVIGVNTLSVSAAANARIVIPTEAASPPFAVPSGNSAGDQVCLKINSNGPPLPYQADGVDVGVDPMWPDPLNPGTAETDPCEDPRPASEFFFTLAPSSYETCSATSEQKLTVAEGIDHNLSSFEPDYGTSLQSPVIEEGCKGSAPPRFFPNTMPLGTGLDANALQCGLLSLKTGVCASGPIDTEGEVATPRFQRGPYVKPNTFAGERMENKALWDPDFFQPGASPASCANLRAIVAGGAGGYDYFDLKERMIDCLEDWSKGDGPIFTAALVKDSGRFAFLPFLYESTLATSPVHFNSFIPVFLQKLYQVGSENAPTKWDPFCFYPDPGPDNSGWFMHEAGQAFNCGKSTDNVDRLSAIVLACGMLPDDLCLPDGPPNDLTGQPRLIIELTR